jgi:hypothetical protein
MIQKVLILGMTLIMGVYLMMLYTFFHPEPYVPAFKGKECFKFRNHTDTKPDGIVAYTKGDYYVIMWFAEADKRYAGPKIGNEIPAKWLDHYANRITCPKGWVS